MDALIALADAAVFDLLTDASAVYHALGQSSEVRGLFDRTYRSPGTSHVSFSEEGPTLCVRAADLHVLPEEDALARVWIGSETFEVREVRPDGKGLLVLVLGRVDS